MIQGHGGNVDAMARNLACRPEDIIDMSSNINPLGMPPGLKAYLQKHLHRIGTLPEADGQTAIAQMALLLDMDPRCMLAGNGTTQFIYTVCPALGAKKVLVVGPTYADYADACRMHRIRADHFLADPKTLFQVDPNLLENRLHGYDTVFICNPNNPTGQIIPQQRLQRLCEAHQKVRFIIDESYLPFAADGQSLSKMVHRFGNLVVLWSLSKIFGVPGLRAGFLMASPDMVSRFECYMQPWSLNSMAQVAVDFLGRNRATIDHYVQRTRAYLKIERQKFNEAICSCKQFTTYPSQTSYLLIKLPQGFHSSTVCRRMAEKRILIRDCRNFYGLSDQFIRIALKTSEVNQLAVDHLVSLIGASRCRDNFS